VVEAYAALKETRAEMLSLNEMLGGDTGKQAGPGRYCSPRHKMPFK
jgi:hypothetical protein